MHCKLKQNETHTIYTGSTADPATDYFHSQTSPAADTQDHFYPDHHCYHGIYHFFWIPVWYFAQYLGIGRGVDLVMYFGMLGLAVCCLLLYLRMQQLQQQLTELAREMALLGTPRKPAHDPEVPRSKKE